MAPVEVTSVVNPVPGFLESHQSISSFVGGPSTSGDDHQALTSSGVVPFDELVNVKATDSQYMNYRCPVCGKEFYGKEEFRRHYRVHTGEKPFACPVCPHKARQASNLKAHILAKHNDRM